MDIMDEVFQSAKQAFGFASQKTGEAIEIGKLQLKVTQAQAEIRKLYEQIGSMIYLSRKNGSDPSTMVDSLVHQIDRLSAEIDAVQARIQQLRQLIKCTRCGAQNAKDALYCSRCGAPLKAAPAEPEPETVSEPAAEAPDATDNQPQ